MAVIHHQRTQQQSGPSSARRQQWGGILTGALCLIAYGGMVGLHLSHGTLRGGVTPVTLRWFGLAFAGYLGALLWAEAGGGLSPRIIWGGAILFRVMLLFTTPTLSDDVYRYIWDGHIALNGVSPYALPVESPALDYLDIPPRALANNTWMASPYLPAAQVLFAGLVRVFPPTPLTFQLAMVVLELLAGRLLVSLLSVAGLPPHRSMIYLWNPLAVVEVAHGAHLDAWMLFLALLAVWLAVSSAPGDTVKQGGGAVALALATLTKGLPALLAAIFFWRWRWRQRILFLGVVAALLLPAGLAAGWGLAGPLDGTGLFGALRIYGEQWNFNSGLFHWLEESLLNRGVVEANRWAKRVAGGVMALTMMAVWLKARRAQPARAQLRLMMLPFAAYILLTPTVHPWYVLMVLVFVPFQAPHPAESFRRWTALGPWVYLSGAVALSYLTYLNPLDFRELEWVRRWEWWPALALGGVWVVGALLPRRRRPVE